MSYDDLANKHLRWWATDKNDPRSGVRLRHLLSFTSGFTEDALGACAHPCIRAQCAGPHAWRPTSAHRPHMYVRPHVRTPARAHATVTCAALNFDFEGCAERLYHKSRNYTAPGTRCAAAPHCTARHCTACRQDVDVPRIYFGHADGERRGLDRIGGQRRKALGETHLQAPSDRHGSLGVRRRRAPRCL